VRYENGETDSWRLTDALATDLGDFVTKMIHSSAIQEVFSFPVMPEEGAAGTDFGFVSLRMEKVIAWQLDGLVNAGAAATLWAEMEGPSEGAWPGGSTSVDELASFGGHVFGFPQLTWERAFAGLVVLVNVGALLFFVGFTMVASRCNPHGTPDSCNVRVAYELTGFAVVIAALLLLFIWAVGRVVQKARHAAWATR
jgi:hypothetical protein